jgi:hypothetical protein
LWNSLPTLRCCVIKFQDGKIFQRAETSLLPYQAELRGVISCGINIKYNLKIRTALEHIYQNYNGDKTSGDWKILKFILREFGFLEFITYLFKNQTKTIL